MGKTVAQLLREISARELAEWYAYERAFGPLGNERIDYIAAIIAERLTNRGLTNGSQAAPLSVFLPKWGNRE